MGARGEHFCDMIDRRMPVCGRYISPSTAKPARQVSRKDRSPREQGCEGLPTHRSRFCPIQGWCASEGDLRHAKEVVPSASRTVLKGSEGVSKGNWYPLHLRGIRLFCLAGSCTLSRGASGLRAPRFYRGRHSSNGARHSCLNQFVAARSQFTLVSS